MLETGLPELVARLRQDASRELAQVDAALGANDLAAAAEAAHAARNTALMFGAKPLLEALETLEAAARDGRLPPALAALARVRTIWPGICEELERLVTASSD